MTSVASASSSPDLAEIGERRLGALVGWTCTLMGRERESTSLMVMCVLVGTTSVVDVDDVCWRKRSCYDVEGEKMLPLVECRGENVLLIP